ncbi:MAG TPA: hypothetical protein VEH84_10320 [Alphaproteobacteria bacterium]|nr:hypothetical protein [Alphaproteobacteria bacterium]
MPVHTEGAPRAADTNSLSHFELVAAAETGLLARVIEPFARRDLPVIRFHAAICRHDPAEMVVDIAVAATDAEEIGRVAGNLRQIVGVTRVVATAGRG